MMGRIAVPDFASAIALLLAASSAPPQAAAPAPIDCRDEAHRALDFWIGDWVVSDTRSGVPIATSRVELIAGNCALRETYDQNVGPGNRPIDYHGTSYSALNSADHEWRQLYVDTGGAALSYFGGVEEGAMVLVARAGSLGTRMTIRKLPDGSVRQSGEITRDGGATWSPGHDFTYRRR
jgi:hypothetical protein